MKNNIRMNGFITQVLLKLVFATETSEKYFLTVLSLGILDCLLICYLTFHGKGFSLV